MIIKRIEMTNFRKFRQKTMDFKGSTVVLLSAANGVGKTTVIDAIEWCLTGNIKRLKTAFDTRSPNDDERKINSEGILKNREADGAVRVSIVFSDSGKEITLIREQKQDILKSELSKTWIKGYEKTPKEFIDTYVGNSFYNYHFCDVQKSFNIQSKKRNDLEEMFNEFITNYDKQRLIAINLELFAKDTRRKIDFLSQQMKELDGKITDTKMFISSEKARANPVKYPNVIFYVGEKSKIDELKKEELLLQKAAVENCGYLKAKECLSALINTENLENQLSIINKLCKYWKTHGQAIQRAVNAGLFRDEESITNLQNRLIKLNELTLSQNTIFVDAEKAIALGIEEYSQSIVESSKNTIAEKELEIKKLSTDIELLTKNNRMLALLSSLSANKQTVIDYRNESIAERGSVRCPICGSESFATLENEIILKEADEYIRINGESVKAKETNIKSLLLEINSIYKALINYTEKIVKKEKEKLAARINELIALQKLTQPYFVEAKRLQITKENFSVESLTLDKLLELQSDTRAKMQESKKQAKDCSYQKILKALGYKFENETIQQTYAKVDNLITATYKVKNFTYTTFVSKLNAIDSIITNERLLDLKTDLANSIYENRQLVKEVRSLEKLEKNAYNKASKIKDTVEALSQDEYKKVGPAIEKYYNKLARFNYADEFRIIPEQNGISLVDSKDKNIVNVLSNGQISIFMLAHFFAGITARNSRENLKVFFMDDLTSCLDEVNILALMDLLKYQLASKGSIEQLFFISCNERVSELLNYKLTKHGIKPKILREDFFCE